MNYKGGKEVENNQIQRIVRTLSYFLIFVFAFIFGLRSLEVVGIGFIDNLIKPINDFIANELLFLDKYLLLLLLIGFLGLVWTQTNSIFNRIFTTIIILIVTLVNDQLLANKVISFLPRIDFIADLAIKIVGDKSWAVLLILLVPILLIYIIIESRRPKRLPLKLIGTALGFMIIALVVSYLPSIIKNDWGIKNWFIITYHSLYVISYTLMSLGSIFGVIGFFRK